MNQTSAGAPRGEPGAPGHVRALDGMRAVAVILVFGFHLRFPGFGAGWLGVDVFFVLSGFLITSLLIAEMERKGQIGLAAFWARRARRLLPALVVVLLVVAVVTHTTATLSERASLRGDLLAATAYAANWRFIATSSYFVNTGVESPLQHTWSLAIEEQFYLFWPVLLAGAFWILRRSRMTVTALAVVGIAASAVAMAVLYHPGTVERAYMGTDARIFEPLVGALGAVLVASPRGRALIGLAAGPLLMLGSLGVLAGLVVIRPDAALYYRGGGLLFSFSTLMIVAPLWIGRGKAIGDVLSWGPIAWLGVISYGVYLWHWPMILWTGARDVRGAEAVVRGAEVVALTVGVAALSYYLIERPIREGRRLGHHLGERRVRHPGRVLIAVPFVLLLVATVSLAETKVPPPPPGVPVILLTGDSVPMHLEPTFERVAGSLGWRVVSAARGSCPVSGEGALQSDQVDWCPKNVPRLQDALIRQDHPDIVVWWDRWSVADFLTAGGERVTSGTPRFWKLRAEALDRTVRRLTADGAKVVFVATEPPGEGMLTRCTPADCQPWERFQVDHYKDITSHWNQVMSMYAQKHPDLAAFISVTDVVCRTDVSLCNDVIDGSPARPDGTHYAGAGATMVSRRLVQLISPILADGSG